MSEKVKLPDVFGEFLFKFELYGAVQNMENLTENGFCDFRDVFLDLAKASSLTFLKDYFR